MLHWWNIVLFRVAITALLYYCWKWNEMICYVLTTAKLKKIKLKDINGVITWGCLGFAWQSQLWFTSIAKWSVGPVPRGTWSLQVMIGSSIWPLFLILCFFYVCDSFSLVVVQDFICPQKAVHAICLQQSGFNYDAQHVTTSRPHQCSCSRGTILRGIRLNVCVMFLW